MSWFRARLEYGTLILTLGFELGCAGGGFVIPMNKEYLPLMQHLRSSYAAANPGCELSIALMEYSNGIPLCRISVAFETDKMIGLTPTRRYPHQLSQASHALSHLLSLGAPPSSVSSIQPPLHFLNV